MKLIKYNVVWEVYSTVQESGKRNLISSDVICTCDSLGSAYVIKEALLYNSIYERMIRNSENDDKDFSYVMDIKEA